MAMKLEDEVKHMSEVLDIKIEVSNDGAEDEAKESMEITEKIKRVIEESFGNENVGDAASKDVAEKDSLSLESSDKTEGIGSNIEIAETDAVPLVDNVIKLDYSNMSNDDYDDIAESDSDHDSLELEEIANAATARSEEDQKETDEKLKLFAKEMRKLKTLPVPGSRKSNFRRDIQNAFEKLLPPKVLAKLTPNRCGLCHEDFTSERYAWKHYTGYNHKRTVRYFINGTYKDHPSFYNMVLDAIHSHNPESVTEKQIFEFIKKEHPVGDDVARTMNLIRQRGLSRLLQIEYVVNLDGKFTATQALLNRKKRSKQLLDRTESTKYPEPVMLQDTVVKIKEKEKINKMNNSDYKKFQDQIFDFSKKDLPRSVIDTLTLENCGLCHLDIYCKPWSHYTGAGHRTTVELYQSGSYLGHPPYPTMVEKYIKEMQPASLKESDIIKFLKKNFNIGEDMEKVQARVEKCVEMLNKKKDSSQPKMKLPSDNLFWFKKDSSEDKLNKIHLDDKKEKIVWKMRNKEDRVKDDDKIKDVEIRRTESSSSKEHRSSTIKNQLPLKRKSSPGYPERARDESYGRSIQSDREYLHRSSYSSGRSRGSSGRSDDKHRNDLRWNERISRGENQKQNESSVQKTKSPDKRRRSPEKFARSPNKKMSHEKLGRPSSRPKSSERRKRSPDDKHERSRRRNERSPDARKTSSRSYHLRAEDHKRSRRSSGSHQRDDAIKKETLNASRSPNEPAVRPGSSRNKDGRRSKDSSSKSTNIPVRHSYNTTHSQRQETDDPVNSAQSRPQRRDPLSNLTNPSPPPGSLPPDLMMAAPNTAIPAPVTQQSQMSFPGSFLTQHPQFPHVFILNTMGSQMGGQMMMPVPMGQHPPPNQPPTL